MAFIDGAPAAVGTAPPPKLLSSAPAGPKMTVQLIEDAAALTDHVAAWEDLAADAIEPNVFHEPWMLRPALRAFGAGQRLQFVLIYRNPARPKDAAQLCGFFPLERRKRYKGLPVSVLAAWRHLHCFLCTPLLRAGHALEALETFLRWARTDRRGAAVIDFGTITADGPFQEVLVDYLYKHRTLNFVSESWTRALLKIRPSAEEFLTTALSTGYRKEMRRLRRRLGELGRLESRLLDEAGAVDWWLDAFLALEAAGWKGQCGEGTAIGLHADQRTYFREVVHEAFRRDRLQMAGLFLENRPIAMTLNVLSGRGGFHCKIAYDESLARFSPGVQLELDLVEHAHRRPGLRWLDSCAVPDHPMINRLWPDRRVMQKVAVSTGRRAGDLAVSLPPLARWLKRALWGCQSAAPSSPTDIPLVTCAPAASEKNHHKHLG
jgi:CelD/BcsL family acetyltransferase involved in cellulose biosynthesis